MTVRFILSAAVVGAALTASACASTSGSHPTYQQELDRLTADCRERGGILTPVGAPNSGRPQTDNVCEIRGGGGRVGS